MHHTRPNSRIIRQRILVWAVATIAVLAAIGVGVYGLVFAPDRRPSPPSIPSATSSATRPGPSPTTDTAKSGDPEAFARHAAHLLFDWDAATDTPTGITQALTSLGDPTGRETPGLVSDITQYLSDQAVWKTLGQHQTSQRIDIHSIAVPSSWSETSASAPSGQLLPGTVAYTITGTRHRSGTVDGQPSTTSRPVALTMFVTCQPSFPQCHLMRLSMPDHPMR